jgi:ATP-dependent helicase YprA (DUF1998 family)/Zn finger protein HypA/HybF involved in hydrogenase expression
MAQTIQETISQLHGALSDYIEATYHIGSPELIKQRRQLLDKRGVISQVPYLESTPRYKSGLQFSAITGLPSAALELFVKLSKDDGNNPKLLYDPPYKHQSESLARSLVEGLNLLIMTGTGSGKTESFLLPILGKLAREAQINPSAFKNQPAVRALVLYPMNALVNDQLGRLRALFGDARTVEHFKKLAQRPARFARYTSRTPYAGIRDSKKDGRKLKAFNDFYVDLERRSKETPSDDQSQAQALIEQLKARGKWPAKPDLISWYGKGEWQVRKTDEFKRAITLPNDVELLTRHEIQANPPDLLVTNYSMLEYMLMRPIERSIFDMTRSWLEKNPTEKFLVVLDEAHLYRGAAGAEVGLLLRRLRDRLEIPPERFQVICATASFQDAEYAPKFGAQLSGVPAETFTAIKGELALREAQGAGGNDDMAAFTSVDLDKFYATENDIERAKVIEPLLKHFKVKLSGNLDTDLFQALDKYPPLGLLINETMKQARRIDELGSKLYPDATDKRHADTATTVLMALASMARLDPKGPGLLPCRIHNFFRGLPGLWVCMDPACSAIPEAQRNDICGKMYGQPRERCECDARVHEFFTCRFCGTAYARAYTDEVENPSALWSMPGKRLSIEGGETSPLMPLDILLEQPSPDQVVEPVRYDLETGRINPAEYGPRTRNVFLRRDRATGAVDDDGERDESVEARGKFIPCACCGTTMRSGRSTVQDHQTKGDQPFQSLVARQIKIQPPSAVPATRFAPLRGRKVLVFSDSRQVAARLAPNLQQYSTRDSLRPLISYGYNRLLQSQPNLKPLLSLEDLFLGVLLGSKKLVVRLRPELKGAENFTAEEIVEAAVRDGSADTEFGLQRLLLKMRSEKAPEALIGDIVTTVQDPFLGLEALALASICECGELTEKIEKLPNIPGIAETPESKVALVRTWLRCWRKLGFWLTAMPGKWRNGSKSDGLSVREKKGKGKFTAMDKVIVDKAARKIFNDKWTPELLVMFTNDMGGAYQLRGGQLSLSFEGEWVRCATCKSVHRPMPGVSKCLDCTSPDVSKLDPDNDSVFLARKGYYRRPVMAALSKQEQPMAIIAAEHTAQLNAPQNEDVFSKAEENELLFQDVLPATGRSAQRAAAVDVLSSTTTMEVGIDIGALSGVALRNMPPGRANYQQRAGRAGRRGNAVATVVAFGSADSHDEHYFEQPDGMITGNVVDPKLTLENREITQRHIRAFLIQRYLQDRLPAVDPEQRHDLFSVLGGVSDFRDGKSVLNIHDFKVWIEKEENTLKKRIATWIPSELSAEDRAKLLAEMKVDCVKAIEDAIGAPSPEEKAETTADAEISEEQAQEGEENPNEKPNEGQLLGRLLYHGILPRYAFPTDVATFHVFDEAKSSSFRPVMKFAPSQGLPIALSQYAPGKEIWISGKSYTSGAIYSVMSDDRFRAWENKRIYCECSNCSFARTEQLSETSIKRNDVLDCPACGAEKTFGAARYWLRPPGFAHPVGVEEVTSPDDAPEVSYATRAKLTMASPSDATKWKVINERISVLHDRNLLLVSNTGPKQDGYSYCTKCGRIEASSEQSPLLFAPHRKPFVDDREPQCAGDGTAQHIVLGTDFITDIALISMSVQEPLRLKPGQFATDVALRTVSEAVAKAASQLLEIEPGELMAEYRPSLTQGGKDGTKAEIFLYDTLPGGAGFATQLAGRGVELFERALHLLKGCPEQCDASCYRCLRSFKNKFEHSLLDRHVGIELLEYLLHGQVPVFDAKRLNRSTEFLFQDLKRQPEHGVTYKRDAEIKGKTPIKIPILATRSDGKKFAVCLSGPLTNDHPADHALLALKTRSPTIPLIVENELVVQGNLPAATRRVQSDIQAG